jgi:hypothetical protein
MTESLRQARMCGRVPRLAAVLTVVEDINTYEISADELSRALSTEIPIADAQN